MAAARTYTDEQLVDAIASASSWRGALRALGLRATSSGAIRSVRSRADDLGIGYGHFGHLPSWSDSDLRIAVAESRQWAHVVRRLGAADGTQWIRRAQRDARRLGVSLAEAVSEPVNHRCAVEPRRLARAGPMLAAAWYTLHGHDVSWPLEPCRYDLLVDKGGDVRRVQVKTTTALAGGSWKVYVSTSRQGGQTYGTDEVDEFFIIDGELRSYRIPVNVVDGIRAIHLSAYERFRVGGFDGCALVRRHD